jgi:hypothetical protein
VLREYDLGHSGCDYVLRTLRDGRALSTALAQTVERRWNRTYTLLPGGIEDVEAHKFDEPLRQIDYSVNRSDKFLLALKDYSAIDALASHFSDFMFAQSHAFLWIEDYLARPGDPILTTRSTGSMTVIYLNSTIVYSVNGKALLASGQPNRTLRLTRSMPVWNGAFLRTLKFGFTGNTIVRAELLASILSEAMIIFVMAYDMDGFVFCELNA